jgi:hypothetical protein
MAGLQGLRRVDAVYGNGVDAVSGNGVAMR